MKTALDKLNDLQAWRTITETSIGNVMEQSKQATVRQQQLEARPVPAPPSASIPAAVLPQSVPQLALHQPPPGIRPPPVIVPPYIITGTEMAPHFHGGFDLNAALASGSTSQSPNGHGSPTDHRVVCGRAPSAQPQHPVTGMPLPNSDHALVHHEDDIHVPSIHAPSSKMEFPKFNGDNPRLWCDHCVIYFEVYRTHPAMKTQFAILNFEGAVVTWLQTVERQGRITDWDKLCELVFSKYDKDQYQKHLNQLESLKQTGLVTEYQCQFEKLAHGILLYNPSYDDVFFVSRFVARLKEEIRSAIRLHRPKDVDTTSALALMQEEELNMQRQGKQFGRAFVRSNKPTQDKVMPKTTPNDKIANLKQYRRGNGLSYKCGGKWSTTHTCPDQVPLHVLEELWDALASSNNQDAEDTTEEQIEIKNPVCILQKPSSSKAQKRQTLKLLTKIGKQQVLVLVDSSSIGTFVSEVLVHTLGL